MTEHEESSGADEERGHRISQILLERSVCFNMDEILGRFFDGSGEIRVVN